MNVDHTLASLAELRQFDAIIDARSPSEFAHDHIPGAINCPVLYDDERVRVGTLKLGDLAEGKWRQLLPAERDALVAAST